MSNTKKATSTKNLVMYAVLTAITFVLQYVSIFIRTGTFSITLSLVPIVIGAALLGIRGGAWLGFVFGVAVLASGDAGPFLALSVPGTVITVLAKGTISGLLAGVIFKVLKSKNTTLAVALSAALCPIANTGVFIIGVFVFFLKYYLTDGVTVPALILSFIGVNFFIELAVNIILCPAIVRLIKFKNNN